MVAVLFFWGNIKLKILIMKWCVKSEDHMPVIKRATETDT